MIFSIQADNKCYFKLAKLLRSKILSTNLEIQIYETLIKPVITYRLETGMLWKIDEKLTSCI